MDPAETIADSYPRAPAAPLGVGRTLGEFTLVERIGSGAFADVWRARQARLDREAAVKVPHAAHLARPELVERFLREARLAARLDHPFAAHVYDCGAELDGTVWIAMEYVRGEPLSARLARAGALPLAQAIPFLTQVAQVVGAAHARGIVHRDLKPGNVIVAEEGGQLWPKLLDFGVARDAALPTVTTPSLPTPAPTPPSPPAAPPDRTSHGARLGSPLYMAPEQWRDARSADERSDQYALAILAYEVLTGQAPFRASTLDGLAEAHAVQPLPALGAPLPRGLDAVLSRAAAKRPDDRFPDVAHFARALEAAAAAAPQPRAAMFRVPEPTSGFVGRDAERAAVAAAITRARLVTVVGAGGAGKTRLSIQVATDVAAEFADGVCLVELVEVHTPDEVAPAVARALGVEDSTLTGLRAWIGARRLLLILDNCEHLVEPTAALAHALLRAAPGLRILATSREPLGVPGEATWPLPPMEVPPPTSGLDAAARYDAVRLFVERATAAEPTFRLTAATLPAVLAICHRLDGIPLAIELAAARVRALPPDALAARLQASLAALGQGPRAGVPHHRTLRAAIAWGYGLLSAEEREAWRRLGALPGPFGLEVAAVAIGAPEGEELVLRLVDRSLVTRAPGGARLLEPLREYALEQLEVAGEADAVRIRLLTWLRDEARRDGREAYTSAADAHHHRWRQRTELCADLLARAPGLGQLDVALDLVGCLWRHWEITLPDGEVRTATAALLAGGATDPPERARLRGRAWEAYAAMCWRIGDIARSLEAHREAAVRARAVGDDEGLAVALFGIGSALLATDGAAARDALAEARAIGEARGDDQILAYVHHHLGNLALTEGRLDEAEAHLRLAQRIVLARGDLHGSLVNRYHLTVVTRRRGEHARARAELGRVLVTAPAASDVEAVAECLEVLAGWLLEDDLPAEAVRWEAAAQAVRQECADPLTAAEAAAHADRLTRARDRLGDAAFRAAWAEGATYDVARVLAAFSPGEAP